MSEQLASLRKKGGETGFNPFIAPNASYTNASWANNATYNIAVTQMPKYITIWTVTKGTSYSGRFGVVDVANNTASQRGYWSSASHTEETWPGWENYITSITASRVSIKNVWGAELRVVIEIFY